MQTSENKGLKVKFCENCKKEFTAGRNRHSCKRCLKIVCSECCRDRIKIVTLKDTPLHKACPSCTKESVFQSDFRITYRSSWGVDSKCGESWLAKVRSNLKVYSTKETYQSVLEQAFNSPDDVPGWAEIEKDIDNGRIDNETFNFSIQEFLFFNQEKVAEDLVAVREAVKNVLKAFSFKNQEIGYCQGLTYITFFLLTLLKEESAYWVLTYLFKVILPKKFLVKEDSIPTIGIQIEKEILTQLTVAHLELDETQAKKLKIWLNIHAPVFLSSLGVTYFNYECLFEMFNSMFQELSFDPFRKGFIRMVKITSDFILSNPAYIPSLVQLHIAKFFQASEIRAALLKTPIDSKAVEQMTNKYHDEITAQWEKNTKSYKQCLSHIGQCTVADMASISQDYMFYLVNEKKNIKEDGDISLELFTKFVEQSLKKDPNRVAFLSVINLAEIFNVFDIDKDGKLNFFEFITSFAIMIDGNMLNKLKFIYVLYDTNQKGYLDSSGYHKFLNNIVNTAVIYNNGGYQAFFNDDCDRFFHTFKNHEKLKNPEKVKFSEIGEALSKSPFILTHCREKKKKMSIIKSKSTITGGDNPFNLNPPNLHDDTALPDPVVNFETNTGSVVIEEQKEEQDVSDKSSSVSSEEKNDDVPIDEDPATPEKEETPQEIAQIDSNSSEKNSDEKQNLIFVEHLSAKTAISAWASREKAAQEQQRARTSVTQRPSIQKSRTSIVDQPTLYDNPMKPLSQDQPDDKPILNFPYKENINAHLQTSNTPTLKTHKSHDFSLPTNVDLSLSAPHDKVNTSIAYVIPIHYNCIEPHPTDENYQTSIFYDHEQLFANTSTAPPVHTQDSLSNPASTSSRADYVTPSPKDQNVEVSFLESFAFKRDSSVTPQGPVEKSATVAKTEKPVVVAENNFLNEDALRGRGPMSDEEKQVQKKRAQDAAKEAQGANCKVCNIF